MKPLNCSVACPDIDARTRIIFKHRGRAYSGFSGRVKDLDRHVCARDRLARGGVSHQSCNLKVDVFLQEIVEAAGEAYREFLVR